MKFLFALVVLMFLVIALNWAVSRRESIESKRRNRDHGHKS